MELLKNAIAENKVDDDYIAEAYYEYVEANPRATAFRFATQATIALKGSNTQYTFDKILDVLKARGIISSTKPTEVEQTKRHSIFERKSKIAQKANVSVDSSTTTVTRSAAKNISEESTSTTNNTSTTDVEISDADIEKARQTLEKLKTKNPRAYRFTLASRRREKALGTNSSVERQLNRIKALNKTRYVEIMAERKVIDEILEKEGNSSQSSSEMPVFRRFVSGTESSSDNVPPFIRAMRERMRQRQQQSQGRVEEVKEDQPSTTTTENEQK